MLNVKTRRQLAVCLGMIAEARSEIGTLRTLVAKDQAADQNGTGAVDAALERLNQSSQSLAELFKADQVPVGAASEKSESVAPVKHLASV